jgi:hypothetical protein
MRFLAWLLLFAAAAPGARAAPAPGAAAGAYLIRAVLRTGQPAPTGGVFTEFSDPALNAGRHLAFAALTSSAGAHTVLYLERGGRLATLAVAGRPAPTGGRFTTFNDVVLNDRDTVLFLARTTDRVANVGLYLSGGGGITPVAASGQPAPGGGRFTDFANPTINARGAVAFVGRLGEEREGIFTSRAGRVAPAVVSGQPSPIGGTFQFFLDGSPAENDRGDMAFVAAIAPRGAFAVFVLHGRRLLPVVTTDDEAPVGGRFTEFGSVVLTNGGTVGFIGRTARSAIPEAIYVTGRAALVPLAEAGQTVAGRALTRFANVAINDREEVIFQLSLPVVPEAVYAATRAGVQPVARAGDPAPGGGAFTAFSTPSLNEAGAVAFVAETNDGRHGLYLAVPRSR